MTDEAIRDVVDRLEPAVLNTALFNTLESDPRASKDVFGDLAVFRYDGEPPLIYEAGAGFWTSDAVQASPFWLLHGSEDIRRAKVHRQSEDVHEPVTYDVREYDDAFELLSELHTQEPDGLYVFDRGRDTEPVVYDAQDETFWSEERYGASVYASIDAVHNQDLFVDTLEAVEDRVADREALMHMRSMGNRFRRRRKRPEAIGIATDGEGYTLGRVRNTEPGKESYALVISEFTEDGINRRMAGETITVDRSDIPDQRTLQQRKFEFISEKILDRYSVKPDTAREFLVDTYTA